MFLAAALLSTCTARQSADATREASTDKGATAQKGTTAEKGTTVGTTAVTSAGATCREATKQTGAGCDMEGIRAAVRAKLGPGGPVQACYLKHMEQPRQGKVVVGFSLLPDGKPTGFQVVRDDLGSAPMAECLVAALESVGYPAPGDVPCQVVYPFSFYPEGGR